MIDFTKFELIDAKLEKLVEDYINEWGKLLTSEDDEEILQKLKDLKEKIELIGIGIQYTMAREEQKMKKSGIIIPE